MIEDRENNSGLYVSIINRAASSYFTKALAPFHIGPGMQAYLLVIGDEEVMSQEAITKRLTVDKANVTRAMKSLEQLSLIKREVDPTDKRKILISLTNKGIEVKKEITIISKKWIDILKSPLNDNEWASFNSSLKKIIDNLEEVKNS
ncbi:MAG: MarR family transcriptional regulator [Bacteroidales bacterium]|jgi:DNA-binding MarR family transcriptional regulator|nr:MarR family transcriptional regulator [Bacteroidales bacterium]